MCALRTHIKLSIFESIFSIIKKAIITILDQPYYLGFSLQTYQPQTVQSTFEKPRQNPLPQPLKERQLSTAQPW